MTTWLAVTTAALPILVTLFVGFGMLRKGQSDQEKNTATIQAEMKEVRTSVQDILQSVTAQAERHASMSRELQYTQEACKATAVFFQREVERARRDNTLVYDELRGEITHYGRRIHDLEIWRAKQEGAA